MRPHGSILGVLALAACSDVSGPRYGDKIAAQLATLAPDCNTEPHPNGPGGYDAEVTCRNPDASGTYVQVLVDDERIGQLRISLEESSLDAAITKLGPALAGICSRTELDAIVAGLRADDPTSNATTKVKGSGKPQVGVEQSSRGVTVSVDLDYRKG